MWSGEIIFCFPDWVACYILSSLLGEDCSIAQYLFSLPKYECQLSHDPNLDPCIYEGVGLFSKKSGILPYFLISIRMELSLYPDFLLIVFLL